MEKDINQSPSPEKLLLEKLGQAGLKLATAESCTGGMIAQRLTSVPGASRCYPGGVVSYANEVKTAVLGVREETLNRFGAVSEETAGEMARGVLKITGADVAVSVTGIAGPTGGTPEKPVGCVCFGVHTKNGTRTRTVFFDSTGSREEIRSAAADYALQLAADCLCEETQCLKE